MQTRGSSRSVWCPGVVPHEERSELSVLRSRTILPDVTAEQIPDLLQWVYECHDNQNAYIEEARIKFVQSSKELRFLLRRSREITHVELEEQALVLQVARRAVCELRRYAIAESASRREKEAIDECFKEKEQGYARTYEAMKRRILEGTKRMMARSTGSSMHPDAFERIGGCLCWGSWASVIESSACATFSRSVFPIFRFFGSEVRIARFFWLISVHIRRVVELLDADDRERIFPVRDYVHRERSTDCTKRMAVFVMLPFNYNGVRIKGLVWRCASKCAPGMSVADRMSGEPIVATRHFHSELPSKIMGHLERSGCELDAAQIVQICAESAVIHHVKSECLAQGNEDVFRHIFAGADDDVEGLLVFNPSGRMDLGGHWGVLVVDDAEKSPVIVSTNIHFVLRPNFTFVDENLDTLMTNSSHVSSVLRAYVLRADTAIHGDHNVFIGSKWTATERQAHLPRIAQNDIAAIQIFQADVPAIAARPITEYEYWADANDERKEKIEANIAKAKKKMMSQKWTTYDCTREGTLDRLIAYDWRPNAARPKDALNLGFTCRLSFFGDAYYGKRVPDVDLVKFADDSSSVLDEDKLLTQGDDSETEYDFRYELELETDIDSPESMQDDDFDDSVMNQVFVDADADTADDVHAEDESPEY